MRIREIVLESLNEIDEVIEDEAETRGDAALLSVLELLRNEEQASMAVSPRVEVGTVISRVREIPGNEAFNYTNLEDARSQNVAVKSMIKDISDDPKSGIKYIYLAPPESEPDQSDPLGARSAEPGDPAKVVSSMAKRAASK